MPDTSRKKTILTGANLNVNDAAEMDEFVRQAVTRGKQASREAVQRLKKAGVPIAVSDGHGGVILKRSKKATAKRAGATRRRT